MTSPISPVDSVLLVIAHPDDECMFFAPTLNYLASHLNRISRQVHLLCATSGNVLGLGHLRKQELLSAVSCFGLSESNVTILDEAGFQDGSFRAWDVPKLSCIIGDYVERHNINYVGCRSCF
eukprot:Gregarina_sp_Poly_1__1567@NODE_1398_length_4220_cov_58_320732_g545_i1_p4_GENE_NODE_1398_length_4220_cov_58_320732_g545_i1NODE_1398_length_4220_cov_58_320732_g545_i1_p4_ORF_typecomplete_len122_score3_35PIGL/PF02585_17/3_2e22_NODE_1398_length_4220_cov_58_320732_g545_i1191556